MNTMLNINPWSVLSELLDANSRAFKSMRARACGHFPPVNVFLDDDAIIVDLELPGKTAKDIELSLEPQAVAKASPEIPSRPARVYATVILAAIETRAVIIGVLEFCIEKNDFDKISLYAIPIIPVA